MSLYEISVPQFIKVLGNIDKWFDKAEAYAKSKNFDPSVLLASRLAPDQFALTRQVQITTDSIKLGLVRITGKEAPPFPDDETTFEQLRARLKKVTGYLESLTPADFEGGATRVVTFQNDKKTLAKDHLVEHVIPTFYFHVVTTYSILRHNGVDLGKRDYIGGYKLQS